MKWKILRTLWIIMIFNHHNQYISFFFRQRWSYVNLNENTTLLGSNSSSQQFKLFIRYCTSDGVLFSNCLKVYSNVVNSRIHLTSNFFAFTYHLSSNLISSKNNVYFTHNTFIFLSFITCCLILSCAWLANIDFWLFLKFENYFKNCKIKAH